MSYNFHYSGTETNQISAMITSLETRVVALQSQVTPVVLNPISPLQRAKEYYRKRRLREQMFENPDLFADPAWDILIDLFIASEEGHQISVSSACIASGVPASTALRWIKILEDTGHIARHQDPSDARRIFISLSERSVTTVRAYFCD